MSRKGLKTLLAMGVVLAGLSTSALAQDQGQQRPDRGQDRGERGERGNFDPAQMRERMLQRYKEQLGATDEEFKVLQPKLEKVMTAQREGRSGGFGFGGFTGRGGDRGRDRGSENQSAVAKANSELRAAVEANASADELTKRLATLRETRAKAREDLAAAQKELKELVTAKQEAQLVIAGLLE